MPLSEKAQQTKTLLLQTAREIATREGLERLTMDRVSQCSNMSKGAVMYHFPTKKALIVALFTEYAEHLNSEFEAHVRPFQADHADRALLLGFLAWFQSFDKDNKGWANVGIVLLSQHAHDPELLTPVRNWYERVFTRLRQQAGAKKPEHLLVLMALEGLFYTHKFGLDLVTKEEKAQIYELMNRLI